MASKDDEQILVVKSSVLFEKGAWQGLKTDNLDYYVDLIKKNCEFKRRGDMETDNSYQQIIPYMLFGCDNKFFAYTYLPNAGEQRLVNKNYQLGVGGHINKEDIKEGKDILEEGMMREWDEEVNFKGNLLDKKLVGIINDDTNAVEQVHVGLVFHFAGDSSDIQVKETDKMKGEMFSIEQISSLPHSPWMKIAYENYLAKKKFKNIIFDWSGVIKDALQDFGWVVNRMREELGGKEISLEEIRQNWEQPYMKFWNKYYPDLTLEEEQILYRKILARKDCPNAGVVPGMADLITKLKKRGLKMSVVSSDHAERLLSEIKEFGLENVFGDVITDVHDKSEGVEILIKKYNLNPEETVFIGDSNHEIEVGKYFGIKTIAVTWGFAAEDKLKATNPDYLVHNIKELEKILMPSRMVKSNYPGKFIVIEGLDGSGKSAQVDLVIDFLKKQGKDVVVTREPTMDSGAGRKIKQALKKEITVEPLELQKLYVQDRKEHLENKVIPALKQSKIVVSSRYAFSTFAYGYSDGLDVDLLVKMNDNFLLPDLTIIVDVSPESCVKRIEGRGQEKELFEQKEKLTKVNEIYKKMPQMFENIFMVDGEKPISEVFENIKNIIIKKFNMKVLQNAGSYKILAIMTGLNGEDPLSLIETAGRTAYQSRDKITNESAVKFAKALRVRGHESVFEHSAMTVEFNDVSRGLTHELVRHRLAAYTQESTRYVDEKEFRVIAPPNKNLDEKLVDLVLPGAENSGLKVSLKVSFNDWMNLNEQMYKGLRAQGWVPQDARQVLPNGLKSQIVVTANLREWRHIFKMRCAVDAHWEIREVMVKLLKEVKERIPVLFDDFEISSDGQSATLVRPQF